MRAGYAKSDITPPPGVELAGYGYYLARRAEAVMDPLYARALLLEGEDGARSLILSCDLLGLNRAVVGDIERAAECAGVPRERVIAVSVHTHTGPALIWHEGCGYPDPEYVSGVSGRIVRAIRAAADDLSPVSGLRYGRVTLPGSDGNAGEDRTGRHGFAEASEGSGYTYNRATPGGPVDRTARAFVILRGGARPVCIASAACHGVFNGCIAQISADFAGAVNRELDEKGYEGIFLNGTCGDIDPTVKDAAHRDAFARAIAGAADVAHRDLPPTLSGGEIKWRLRTRVMDDAQRRACADAVARRDGRGAPTARVAEIWAREMPSFPQRMTGEEDAPVRWCALGGVSVVACPFEGYTAVADIIRRDSGSDDALVLGCAGELMGYLPTVEDIENGSYAARESIFLYKRMPVLPGEAERLGHDVGAALRDLMDRP